MITKEWKDFVEKNMDEVGRINRSKLGFWKYYFTDWGICSDGVLLQKMFRKNGGKIYVSEK